MKLDITYLKSAADPLAGFCEDGHVRSAYIRGAEFIN
jgi:hypothetical protein